MMKLIFASIFDSDRLSFSNFQKLFPFNKKNAKKIFPKNPISHVSSYCTSVVSIEILGAWHAGGIADQLIINTNSSPRSVLPRSVSFSKRPKINEERRQKLSRSLTGIFIYIIKYYL